MLDEELMAELNEELPKDVKSIFISSVANKGITELKDQLWQILNH